MTSLRNLNVTHQYGDVAQLVRASSLYLEGRRFNSCRPYKMKLEETPPRWSRTGGYDWMCSYDLGEQSTHANR